MSQLVPREEMFRIPSGHGDLQVFLRYMAPERAAKAENVVLYVHGGTFPSALSIAHRLDGRSWRDDLCDAGFHVWGLDFHGFGSASDPYPEMSQPADGRTPLGRTAEASVQLESAVRFILARHGTPNLSLVAHSWGCLVAGHFAARCPDLVQRMVLFGPIARRDPVGERTRLPAWRAISLQDQWDRFTADVPAGEAPVMSRRHFDTWGEAYLDCDPASRERTPPSVKVPGGAFQDIYDAWAGEFPYDPALITAPVAIIRGEWDSLCADSDAKWLFDSFRNAPVRRDVKISRATHLMHLEAGRFALYRETEAFLSGGDLAPGAT
jgi:pimeloyl-ACP methyl ester carboxylesterase